VSLGGAFLDEGARCVVQARFPIQYEATLEILEHLHTQLAAGESPAVALRFARAKSAGSDPLASFHATSLEVIGLGFEPVFSR
jgi:hypothetical protein